MKDRRPVRLVRFDHTPPEYAVMVPPVRPGTPEDDMLDIGRVWLDADAGVWVAVSASKTAPILGRYVRGFDAVMAVINHHDETKP